MTYINHIHTFIYVQCVSAASLLKSNIFCMLWLGSNICLFFFFNKIGPLLFIGFKILVGKKNIIFLLSYESVASSKWKHLKIFPIKSLLSFIVLLLKKIPSSFRGLGKENYIIASYTTNLSSVLSFSCSNFTCYSNTVKYLLIYITIIFLIKKFGICGVYLAQQC